MDKKKYDKVEAIVFGILFIFIIIFLIIEYNFKFYNKMYENIFYIISSILMGTLLLFRFILAYIHDDFDMGYFGGIVTDFIFGAFAFIMGIIKLVELLKEHVFK